MVVQNKSEAIRRRGKDSPREMNLLWGVDLAILEMNNESEVQDIEELFLSSLAEFCDLHALSMEPICLVPVENQFQWTTPPKGRRRSKIARIRPTATLDDFADWTKGNSARLIERADDAALLSAIGAPGPCLAAPIYTPNRHLLCIVAIMGACGEEDDRLREPAVCRSLNGLISQLTIAYGQFERVHLHMKMQELWDQFLIHDLEPSRCFQILAGSIRHFLPVFGPLSALDRSPLTQVLILATPDQSSSGHSKLGISAAPPRNHLIIRGTTGKEHGGTRVAIEDSISGLPIEDLSLPFFCDDPTKMKYQGRYRNYLGRPARTELVIRLVAGEGEDCVGVINLESPRKNAFSPLDRQTLLDLAPTFGPIAAVLERRLVGDTEAQAVIANSTRKYLETWSQIFRHGMGSPSSALGLDTDALTEWLGTAEKITDSIRSEIDATSALGTSFDRLHRLVRRMRATHKRLESAYRKIGRYTQDFIGDISTYPDEEQIILRQIIDSSIQLANNTLLEGGLRRIKIKVTRDKSSATTRIFCSTLIKQHLQSILDNAVRSVGARMEKDDKSGKIAITIDLEDIPEGQEQRLNKAWIVRIHDNGDGVTRDELAALQKFEGGVTYSRGGHGTGLTAAQGYVDSIGGRMKLNSEHGKFFEVALYLNEYTPEIHDPWYRTPSEDRVDG